MLTPKTGLMKWFYYTFRLIVEYSNELETIWWVVRVKDDINYSQMRASLVAQMVKNPPTMQETWIWSQGWEDPLEKGRLDCWLCLVANHFISLNLGSFTSEVGLISLPTPKYEDEIRWCSRSTLPIAVSHKCSFITRCTNFHGTDLVA